MEVTFKILRYNPEKDKEPHYEMYRFEAHENMTVLDCLHKIKWSMTAALLSGVPAPTVFAAQTNENKR
jgi:succinate dehydrogenase / fumarate reductase iron-sulfur subunit